MERFKKIIVVFLISFIALSPSMAFCDFSFAEENQWQNVTNKNTLVASYKAYMQSLGSRLIYTANWTKEQAMKGIVNMDYYIMSTQAKALGINLDDLQNELKVRLSENGALQFLYNANIVSAYNQIYAKYLESQGLDLEDILEETKMIYNGDYFTDVDGNVCFIYVLNDNADPNGSTGLSMTNRLKSDTIIYYGTPFIYNNDDLIAYAQNYNQKYQIIYNYNGKNKPSPEFYKKTSNASPYVGDYLTGWDLYTLKTTIPQGNTPYTNVYSHCAIVKHQNRLFFAMVTMNFNNTYRKQDSERISISAMSDGQLTYNSEDAIAATIALAKEGIQNAVPELGKNAVIEIGKDGLSNIPDAVEDYVTDQDPDTPKVDPDVQDGTPNFPKPSAPKSNTGVSLNPDGAFDFQMPDLNLNWNLDLDVNNLPFPFSIPFDIIHFMQVLDAEPVTPEYHFEFTIYHHHYEYDISLHAFDDYMPAFRNIIAFGYVIFLIIATRDIFKVY